MLSGVVINGLTLSFPPPTPAEVCDWGCEEVCSWMGLLGLSDYDDVIHSRRVTGPVLLDLQTKDILVRDLIPHTPMPHVSYPQVLYPHAYTSLFSSSTPTCHVPHQLLCSNSHTSSDAAGAGRDKDGSHDQAADWDPDTKPHPPLGTGSHQTSQAVQGDKINYNIIILHLFLIFNYNVCMYIRRTSSDVFFIEFYTEYYLCALNIITYIPPYS